MFIAPKIVARTYTEAHTFAREILGLNAGQYRVVTSPASLVGREGEVHLVPGWDKRPDRWAIKNKLRFTRLEIIEHSDEPAEEQTSNGDNMVSEGGPIFTIFSDPEAWLKSTSEALGGDTRTPEEVQATEAEADRNAAEARAELASADEDNDVEEDDSDNDVESEERPLNGRRRRRCKDCGELIHPDDVEDHARDHAADMVSLEQKAQENLR